MHFTRMIMENIMKKDINKQNMFFIGWTTCCRDDGNLGKRQDIVAITTLRFLRLYTLHRLTAKRLNYQK